MIQDNVINILSNINKKCLSLGLNSRDITVVAATKYAETPQIVELALAGIAHIGENRIQAAEKKILELNESGIKISKHFIGHLQSNKVKKAVDLFDCIQTVDSLKLAELIESYAAEKGKQVPILVQVNTSGEIQKSGMPEAEALPFLEKLAGFRQIKVLGFMTLAPLTEDTMAVRECFRKLKNLFTAADNQFKDHERIDMKYLSMGMSDDYDIALEEGSNMLRIGRAFFQ